MSECILEIKNISKAFPGVQALDNVSFDIGKGQVHTLLGENGAGKSTLMKILAGVYQPDNGEILLDGKKVEFNKPSDATAAGISIIHQELNLLPHLTIAQNIFIGREPVIAGFILNEAKLYTQTKTLLDRLNLKISPGTVVSKLSVSQQQMVEIAKALSFDSKVIIMDEPTSALSETEADNLFEIIRELKAAGRTVIYISHRMEELKKISDFVTVLRDGKHIQTCNFSSTCLDSLITLMVGREINKKFPCRKSSPGDVVLEVKHLNRKGIIYDICFNLKKGEILGVAGLMGAGRTETARAIFGADRIDSGQIFVNGKKVRIKKPSDSIKKGIGYITEDRKLDGLNLNLTLSHNISLANFKKISRFGCVNFFKQNNVAKKYSTDLLIKSSSIFNKASELSGGNQQKVVLAKWLNTDCHILILDEPTRGIDIGAKSEIYNLMNDLTEQGISIIMISSELPEVLGMSDRIVVFHEGRIMGELDGKDANQKKIMNLATGLTQERAYV